MTVVLREVTREAAEANLAGGRPANVRVADDYPTEFSAGMAQAVGTEGQFHYPVLVAKLREASEVRRFVVHAPLDRPESGRVVEKAGFAMVRQTDDTDEAGNVLLDELIPACGEVAMQALALPDPATMPALFEHATEPAERIERLVRETFTIYERGAPELRAIRREADVHPRVAQDRDQLDALLSALVDTALGPLDTTPQDRAVARALVDLNTWDALRDQGLGPAESVAVIRDMLARRLTSRDV